MLNPGKREAEDASSQSGSLLLLLNSLGRITTNRKYLAQVDGLRFLAIMGVIFVHTGGIWAVNVGREYEPEFSQPALMKLVGLGRYGVELFFVISGFILAYPFVRSAMGKREPVNLRDYYFRRLTRIEPPYLVSMVLFFIATIAIGKYAFGELLPHLLASFGYVHNIVYGTGSLVNNVAWSLEVEIQFYVLFPFLAKMFSWRLAIRHSFLVAIALPSILYHVWAPVGWPQTLLGFGHYFVAGILLCDIYVRRNTNEQHSPRGDLLLIIGTLIFVVGNLIWPRPAIDIINPLAFICIFWAVLTGRVSERVFSWGFIPVVGGMCYSIYLLHARVLSLALHIVFDRLALSGYQFIDVCILFAVLAPACVLVSLPFYLMVERPCMRPDWTQRIWNASTDKFKYIFNKLIGPRSC